jgi:hypothetical protein
MISLNAKKKIYIIIYYVSASKVTVHIKGDAEKRKEKNI